ncbi:MAG: sugar phosphate isomerase/epimerase [Bacteroidales bacterium]|nr:sugar phosphate isomerase/epimerase [Bacteroidales bacterium]
MKKMLWIASALIALASCSAPKQAVKEIGLQLYSVRELIGSNDKYDANHAEVFRKLADMGYSNVEVCWYNDGKFFGHPVAEFKEEMEKAGLKAISTHVTRNLSDEELASKDFSAQEAWWKQCIADHKALGCQYVVVPSFRVPGTLEGLKTYCDYFNWIGKLCAEQGLKFGYHNHAHEFKKIEDQVIYDFMLQNTDPRYVFFEMDVYWAVVGKAAPCNYFRKYPGRFEMLHIKDVTEVGQSGFVGFDAIFNNADVAGLKHYIVEMEGSGVGNILETCRISADYLKGADFVKPSYAD